MYTRTKTPTILEKIELKQNPSEALKARDARARGG